ncbi:winged helix-turn-helix domain-containing protein [Streptomyces sp. NPDC021056]|uniref:winged helix-turn-helix domain-containing protein n=1 Tax=Streptomyces sp. NPDC021056 TaxID=3155012 RepID=UPI0033C7E6F8
MLGRVFGFDRDAQERTVDAHVTNLLRKLQTDPGRAGHLETVYRGAYRFAEGSGSTPS